MAGYSDAVFRTVCRRFGAEFTVSEMVSVKALVMAKGKGLAKTLAIAERDPGDRPYGVQLFGSEPEEFGVAARMVRERVDPEWFDINCGCPVRKVLRQRSGSWLLTDPGRIRRIVEEVKRAVPDRPVSVKIRLGFDDRKNHRETGKAAEDGGADFLVVHARTRPQLFSGPPDLEALAELKALLRIPVVGNGGVRDAEGWRAMVSAGVDAVMVGIGGVGRPWVFAELAACRDGRSWSPPSQAEKVEVFYGHMREFYGRAPGPKRVALTRPQAMQYIKEIMGGRPGVKEFLRRYAALGNWEEVEVFFADFRRAVEAQGG